MVSLFVDGIMSFGFLIQCTSFYISGAFHTAICIIFFTVYSYIGHKLLLSSMHSGQRTASLRKLAVPCIIVVTFIFLETLPDCFIFFDMAQYRGWTIFLFRIDALSNALVYIFLLPKIRSRASRPVRKTTIFQNSRGDKNNDVTETTSHIFFNAIAVDDE